MKICIYWGLRKSEDTKLIRNPPNPGSYTNPLQCVIRCSYVTGIESLQQFRNASPSGTISFSLLLSAGSLAHTSSIPASREQSSHQSTQQQPRPAAATAAAEAANQYPQRRTACVFLLRACWGARLAI